MIILVPLNLIGVMCLVDEHKYYFQSAPLSYTGVVLYSLSMLAFVTFSVLCLLEVCIHNALQNNLCSDIDALDDKLKRQRVFSEEYLYKHYLKFALGNTFYAVLHLLAYFSAARYITLSTLFSLSFVNLVTIGDDFKSHWETIRLPQKENR